MNINRKIVAKRGIIFNIGFSIAFSIALVSSVIVFVILVSTVAKIQSKWHTRQYETSILK
jgi:hypothetical protein